MTPDPKPKTHEDKKYLSGIRKKPCLVCKGKSVASHVRKQYWGAGTSQKPHDYVTIPLCPKHHADLDYIMGYKEFESAYNIDINREIIDNLINWIVGN